MCFSSLIELMCVSSGISISISIISVFDFGFCHNFVIRFAVKLTAKKGPFRKFENVKIIRQVEILKSLTEGRKNYPHCVAWLEVGQSLFRERYIAKANSIIHFVKNDSIKLCWFELSSGDSIQLWFKATFVNFRWIFQIPSKIPPQHFKLRYSNRIYHAIHLLIIIIKM